METTNNQLLALIAAIAINNGEVGHPARTLGFTATDFDTDLCALVSVAHQAQLFIDQRPVPQVTISSAFPPVVPYARAVPGRHGSLGAGRYPAVSSIITVKFRARFRAATISSVTTYTPL